MLQEAIISIHPRFAEAILAGEKSVELRRRIPALKPGTRLWIYATRPTAAVIGLVTVAEIQRGSPSEVWRQFANQTAVSEAEFDAYFEGANEAVAILLKGPVRSTVVNIKALREIWHGFHPPQVLSFMHHPKPSQLSELATALA